MFTFTFTYPLPLYLDLELRWKVDNIKTKLCWSDFSHILLFGQPLYEQETTQIQPPSLAWEVYYNDF